MSCCLYILAYWKMCWPKIQARQNIGQSTCAWCVLHCEHSRPTSIGIHSGNGADGSGSSGPAAPRQLCVRVSAHGNLRGGRSASLRGLGEHQQLDASTLPGDEGHRDGGGCSRIPTWEGNPSTWWRYKTEVDVWKEAENLKGDPSFAARIVPHPGDIDQP